MRFYVPEQIGETQSLTNEGFLLCENVPIARTGELLYVAGEVPVDPGRDGIIRITRDESEVFRPETMASFEGKPVTDDHPSEWVNPENWRNYAKGTVQNVRRGEGALSDCVVADLLITDAAAIFAVREGKREVSCGYEADYEQTGPGRGRQLNIVGNHVALVKQGRCGPRCAIGDEENPMAKRTWMDRLRTAFKAKDEAAFEEELEKAKDEMSASGDDPQRIVIEVKGAEAAKDEGGDDTTTGGGVDDPMKQVKDALEDLSSKFTAFDERLTALESAGKTGDEDDPDKEKTGDEEGEDDPDDDKAKTGDSAALQAEFTDTLARAEMLSPGIKLPTFDAKAKRQAMTDAMCGLRRKALKAAHDDANRKDLVEPFLAGGKADFSDKAMTCDAVRVVFIGASELARARNNGGGGNGRLTFDNDKAGPLSIAEINKRNREAWSKPA